MKQTGSSQYRQVWNRVRLSTRKALTAFAVAELLFGVSAAGQNVTPDITRAQSAAPRTSPTPSPDRKSGASKVSGMNAGAPVASPPNAPVFSLRDSLQRAGYTRVSLKRIARSHITVDGRINGKHVKLIVDTGAPKTHLDSKQVAKCALRWDGHDTELEYHQKVRTARVETIEIGSFSVGRLRIGEHSLGDVNRIGRSYDEAPVDGLLGCEILYYCRAIIDYSSECLFVAHRDRPGGN